MVLERALDLLVVVRVAAVDEIDVLALTVRPVPAEVGLLVLPARVEWTRCTQQC